MPIRLRVYAHTQDFLSPGILLFNQWHSVPVIILCTLKIKYLITCQESSKLGKVALTSRNSSGIVTATDVFGSV